MNIIPEIMKEIDRHRTQEKSDTDLRYAQLCNFFNLCESPIEQQFLFYILDYDPHRFASCRTGLDPDYRCPVLMCRGWQLDDFPEFDVKIFAQYNVERLPTHPEDAGGGTYRVDFLLELSRNALINDKIESKEGEELRFQHCMAEVYEQIVIEVDGHDFHERTKEQARRDRARDRYLTAAGFKVFRFTGSEIYRNIYEVADEVERLLVGTMVKVENGEQKMITIRASDVMKNLREVARYFNRPYGRKHIRGL